MEESILLGGGCFWCLEAVYKRVSGIIEVESGYAGGTTTNPTYEDVSYSNTGHAEVVKLTFDDTKITLNEILDIFFEIHDPTTLNRQGNDVGEQYRSIILYSNENQKSEILNKIAELKTKHKYSDPIVTKVIQGEKFYKAEDYHQNYYENNQNRNPYCRIVIDPKISKLINKFPSKLNQ